MKKLILAAGAAVALALSLAACSSPDAAPVVDEEGAVNSTTAPTPEPGTSINDPLQLEDDIHGSAWTVSVNSVEWNATTLVQHTSQGFVPDDGNVWSMVNVTYTYTGSDSQGGTPDQVHLQVVHNGQSVGDQVLVDPPDAVDLSKPIYSGTTVTGNVVLEIPREVAGTPDNIIAVTPGMDDPAYFVAVP